MAKNVTVIPATLNRFTSTPVEAIKRRRVAGYARVSTDLEEQQSSYAAQMDYYQNYITGRSDWEFVGMYSDEGITATNTKFRDGFNRMIADALAGKIDLIITKSISRFARNTVDSLTTVRKLKENGVEIYFEKENIWTFDSKGELLITIMSSLAQEESRSISENTTWGRRKSFADGKVSVGYSMFLGYDKGFVINEEEAKAVRLIYKMYIYGYSLFHICKELEARGIKTVCGKTKWRTTTITSILSNEKYKGDALLQKKFTVDFLTKTLKKNEGEVQQYYVKGNHPAIIDPDTFDYVQTEMKLRAKDSHHFTGKTVFDRKIRCGECGGWFVSRVWHSNDKYRRVVYRCLEKCKGENKCTNIHLLGDELKKIFIQAINTRIDIRQETIENLKVLQQMAEDTSDLDSELERLNGELEAVCKQIRGQVRGQMGKEMSRKEYEDRENTLNDRYDEIRKEIAEVEAAKEDRVHNRYEINLFAEQFEKLSSPLTEFDDELFRLTVRCITINKKKPHVVTFMDGVEVESSVVIKPKSRHLFEDRALIASLTDKE